MLHIGAPWKTLFTIIRIPHGFQQATTHNWSWSFLFILCLNVCIGFPPPLIVTSQLFPTTLFGIIELWNFMKPGPHSNPNHILNCRGKKRKEKSNNKKALIPKFWGQLWILDKLVRICHMNSFIPFYSDLKSSSLFSENQKADVSIILTHEGKIELMIQLLEVIWISQKRCDMDSRNTKVNNQGNKLKNKN